MPEEFLKLRNSLHKGEFRFDLKPELWRAYYFERPDVEKGDIIKIYKNGDLRGYAICCLFEYKSGVKELQVLELCAGERNIMKQLIDKVVAKGKERDVDLILLARYEEPFEDLFAENAFMDFDTAAIMITLLNPKEFLLALSAQKVEGGRLNLEITGLDPVSVVVGKDNIEVIEYDNNPEVTLSMSDKVFLMASFGKTSILNEVFKGHIKVRGKTKLGVALRFFDIIKIRKTYIPRGDWA